MSINQVKFKEYCLFSLQGFTESQRQHVSSAVMNVLYDVEEQEEAPDKPDEWFRQEPSHETQFHLFVNVVCYFGRLRKLSLSGMEA